MGKITHAIKRIVWQSVHRIGYSIRKNESFAYTDQTLLLPEASDRVIFDIGANDGQTVAMYRELYPRATIHAFESLPDLSRGLQEKFKSDPFVRLNSFAIADTKGTARFNVNQKSDTSSLLQTDPSRLSETYQAIQKTVQVIEVPTQTIDGYCGDSAIERIDIVKLDIQGGELKALQGARNMLSQGKIGIIYAEAFMLPFYQDQPMLGHICEYLSEFHYVLHGIYNVAFSSRSGRCTWMDTIFVSPELLSHSKSILEKQTNSDK
jgi:FkbM family methyltransferase